jgi:lipoyl-dependent peroxiredoxin
MQRKATAVWSGDLKSGQGVLSSPSGVLNQTPYSFKTRFEDSPGTNPEELIAAAHAGCYAMALSNQLASAGMKPERLEATATVTLEKLESGFTITKSHLDLVARVPGATAEAFDAAAQGAKAGCPVSKLLKAEISLSTKLEA